MDQFDYIIIGSGMGGLSTANFLAKYGKSVLVLEKHHIPGGLVTSFARKGVHFDLGIHALYELKENQTIKQFLTFWNAPPVATVPCHGDMVCYIDGKPHVFRHNSIQEDFAINFADHRSDVDRLFTMMSRVTRELFSGNEAPEPPYDMGLLQKLAFGIKTSRMKPTFMKYGTKDIRQILDRFSDSAELKAAIYSYCPYPMVFMAFAYQWGVFGQGDYPCLGMQSIPDAAAASLQKMGGQLMFRAEVTEILTKEGRAYGVRTKDGHEYHGQVISNVSPHYTFRWISNPDQRVRKMQHALTKKKIFPAICALFLSVDDAYDFGQIACMTIAGRDCYTMAPDAYTSDNVPIVLQVYPKRADDDYRSVVALFPLGYSYRENWQTEPGAVRGDAYRKLKNEVSAIVLQRIEDTIGAAFRQAIVSHDLSTPITFERYTYSQGGSFMGWAIDARHYGSFMKQRTLIDHLYLVGQWVFPGFGVAGVMASGYYLARDLLRQYGIDLKKDFAEAFTNQ